VDEMIATRAEEIMANFELRIVKRPITRQNRYDWRKIEVVFGEGKGQEENLPVGRRYRGGKMVLFTEEEVEAIRGFANRLEPVQRASRDQMKLFNGIR
jgi:hypothetical protein